MASEPEGQAIRVTVALQSEGRTWACRHYWVYPAEPDHYRLVDASHIHWLAPEPPGPKPARFPADPNAVTLRSAPAACP